MNDTSILFNNSSEYFLLIIGNSIHAIYIHSNRNHHEKEAVDHNHHNCKESSSPISTTINHINRYKLEQILARLIYFKLDHLRIQCQEEGYEIIGEKYGSVLSEKYRFYYDSKELKCDENKWIFKLTSIGKSSSSSSSYLEKQKETTIDPCVGYINGHAISSPIKSVVNEHQLVPSSDRLTTFVENEHHQLQYDDDDLRFSSWSTIDSNPSMFNSNSKMIRTKNTDRHNTRTGIINHIMKNQDDNENSNENTKSTNIDTHQSSKLSTKPIPKSPTNSIKTTMKKKFRRELIMSNQEKKSLLQIIQKSRDAQQWLSHCTPKKIIVKRKYPSSLINHQHQYHLSPFNSVGLNEILGQKKVMEKDDYDDDCGGSENQVSFVEGKDSEKKWWWPF